MIGYLCRQALGFYLILRIIEQELLAVSWAIVKSNVFLAGLPHFVVLTDHHPLVLILNSQCLEPRLQRLRTRIISQQSGLRGR
jgi:hypothetical protein